MTGDASITVRVRLPSQIARLYGASRWEHVEANTVAQVVSALDMRYPGLGERLTEPDGEIRRWINVFVDGKDIRMLEGIHTLLSEDAQVHIVPSVAGGSPV